MGNVTFNPMTTTFISNGFEVKTDGYIQGTVFDDPAMRYQIEGGQVASGQSAPVWGGLPLTLLTQAVAGANAGATGPTATVATSDSAIDAWCIYNQASAMLLTPTSSAPYATSGMSINFIRPQCLLRLALPINPSAVNTVLAASPEIDLYWDFTNNRLDTSGTGILPIKLLFIDSNSEIVSYNSGTGAVTFGPGSVAVVRI